MSGDVKRMQEMVDLERTGRDSTLRRVEEQLKDSLASRAIDLEAFEQAVMDELRAIRSEVETER